MTRKPYKRSELEKIIQDGLHNWSILTARGEAPDLDSTGYVPGTYTEDQRPLPKDDND